MLVALLSQASDTAADVSQGSGVVAVVGFIIAGFGAVIGAYYFRKRNG